MLLQVAAQDIGQVTYIEPGPDPVVGIIDQSSVPATVARSPGFARVRDELDTG